MTVPLTVTAASRHPRKSIVDFDVDRLRGLFPILRQKVHGKPLIYLDNAATSQKPQSVLDAMNHYYEHDNANVHRGVHVLSERATAAYEEARAKVQRFVHANCVREIIFTRGTTEAINLVAQTFGRQRVQAGDEVVVTWLEHHSNIVPWQMLCQEKHAQLRVVPINEAGELDLAALDKLLTPRTKILSLAHVSNVLGTINPVKRIIELAHSRKIPVLLDGAQAAPHLEVNVQELDCDFYTLSSHKMFGPTGIGALYGKAVHLEAMPPWQGGGDMIRSVTFERTAYNERPYKFEAGTPAIAEAVGLGAAIDFLEAIGLDAIAIHEHQLLERVTHRLQDIPGIRLIGTAREKAAVVSFLLEDPPLSALDLAGKLDLEGIAVRNGHHCCQPLMDRYGISGTVRASFALYNTFEEVDALGEAVEQIAASNRKRVQVTMPAASEPAYPQAVASTPNKAADEIIETFDFLDSWTERYGYIIELGQKLLPMPDKFKAEENRVHGCQSTVFLKLRKRPGSRDVVEFLADSDADIVRGLLSMLQRVYCGQHARDIAAFDIQAFFARLGLDTNLSMGRRNGLAEMVQRVRKFAGMVVAEQEARP
jgi:cysteine desulfurase/selenocysteine lyase